MQNSKIVQIRQREFDPAEIDPQDLLPILNKWRAAEPDKYRTLVNMICMSADINPQSLTGDRRHKAWQK